MIAATRASRLRRSPTLRTLPCAASRFVVQLHDATTLHFDLRLEIGDVLRSWAVPKGPSLDPRPATGRPVEDHHWRPATSRACTREPRGTGAVIIWDEGTAQINSDDPSHLSFVLHGHKLRGRFGLTRTGEDQWILVKARDGDAQPGSDIVAERPESVRTGRTWRWRKRITRTVPPKLESPCPRRTRRRRRTMAENATTLRGISELRGFFRTNEMPVYFVSPPRSTCSGSIGGSASSGTSTTSTRSTAGTRTSSSEDEAPRAFGSIEDVCNYLLGHKGGRRLRPHRGPGKAAFVMFDEETERRAPELGLDVALPPAELRHRLDSKIETTQLAKEAGVPSVPERDGAGDELRRGARARRPAPASATTWSSRPRTATRARRRSSCANERDWKPTPGRSSARSSRS